jgi:hypothetical protein
MLARQVAYQLSQVPSLRTLEASLFPHTREHDGKSSQSISWWLFQCHCSAMLLHILDSLMASCPFLQGCPSRNRSLQSTLLVP